MIDLKQGAALCALLTASGGAFAQDAQLSPADEALVADTVIVIGTKIEQSLQDLEVSAEVFDPERLDRERITEVSDLLAKVPNVNTSGGADANFSIRGIGRGGVGGAGQGVTSNIYVDGAPLTSIGINRGPATLWDVEQVEILRGPQSSVQGRNALAGAVVIQTADPTFEPEGKFRASIAEGNTQQYAGAISGPIIDGLLAGRLAVDYQTSDGFVTNVILNEDFNQSEGLVLRGKLLLEPDALPAFSTKLTVDYNESEIVGIDQVGVSAPVPISDPGFASFDPTDLESFNQPLGNDNAGIRLVSESTYDFTDVITGRAILTYESYENDRAFGDPGDIDRFGNITFNTFEETIFSAEGRLEFDYGDVRGLVGAYYYEDESTADRDQRLVFLQTLQSLSPPSLRPLISATPDDSQISLRSGETFETENYAVFGQVEWQFAPQWSLSLGARYDVEEFTEVDRFETSTVDRVNCLVTAPAAVLQVPGVPPLTPITLDCQTVVAAFTGTAQDPALSADFDAFLPRASLTYDINADSSVFVSASRGYRAGGSFVALELNPDGVGTTPFVGTYDPEFLTTYEIGTRNVFLNGALTFNANVFYSVYEDQQLSVDVFNPNDTRDDQIVNAGESTIYGLELTAEYDINEAFDAFVTLGLLETEFDDFPFAVDSDGNPTNPGDPRYANLAGNDLPGAPNLTFTIGGSWEGANGLFADGSFSYVGEAESDAINVDEDDLRRALIDGGFDPNLAAGLTERSDVRTDLTARFGWQSDRISVFVFGSNLFDDDGTAVKGFSSVSRESGQLALVDEPFFTLQPPRVIGAGIDVSF